MTKANYYRAPAGDVLCAACAAKSTEKLTPRDPQWDSETYCDRAYWERDTVSRP